MPKRSSALRAVHSCLLSRQILLRRSALLQALPRCQHEDCGQPARWAHERDEPPLFCEPHKGDCRYNVVDPQYVLSLPAWAEVSAAMSCPVWVPQLLISCKLRDWPALSELELKPLPAAV